MIILGIDPGSLNTGYALISCSNNSIYYITSGIINITIKKNTSKNIKKLYIFLKSLIIKFNPNLIILEHIFNYKNIYSIIKLSYFKSIILLAIKKRPLLEYSSIKIKYIITGKSCASKNDIQNIIKFIFNLKYNPTYDESDAISLALTYYYLNIYKNGY